MGIYTKEEQFKLMNEDWKRLGIKDNRFLRIIDNQYEEVCLEIVKQDGLALKYVKDQTHEICLEAIKQDGEALKYVKE